MNRMLWFVVFGCFILIACEVELCAEVRLPALISDGMVLQEGIPVTLWGTADPDERITVTLGTQRVSAVATGEGQWSVKLGPLAAGGPFTATIAGKKVLTLHDVLVGEVWICSGQSNMKMWVAPGEPEPGWNPGSWKAPGVANYQDEVAHADYPRLHLFTVEKGVAGKPQRDVKGHWAAASPQTVYDFSAVGYFFGRDLFKTLNVPIGMICSSGGSLAEAWMSREALKSNPEFKSILDGERQLLVPYPQSFQEFEQRYAQWKQVSEIAEIAGEPIPEAPTVPPDPRRNQDRPAGLFNAMIAPLTPYGIKGVIWYQGESNTDRPAQYRELFRTLIRDWRRAWGEGDFPFLFVQLANWGASIAQRRGGNGWPELREAQLMTHLSVPHTGMVVTIDIGDSVEIHYKNKQEVSRRLVLAAEAIAYGRDVAYSGPIYDSMAVEGDKIRLHFQHSYGGLMAKKSIASELVGFEIAGQDRNFVPAAAQIEKGMIVVRSDLVKHPVAVRYGWGTNPRCNLFNLVGLPASPFLTED
jgi:sialate O-acetylesterase